MCRADKHGRVVEVVPAHYLVAGVIAAVGIFGGLTVAEFAELPYHLGAGSQQHLHSQLAKTQEGILGYRKVGFFGKFHAIHTIGGILEGHALFVVALGICHGAAPTDGCRGWKRKR